VCRLSSCLIGVLNLPDDSLAKYICDSLKTQHLK